jgi:hypothetical protein
MNYLTNYYKNLCERLQAEITHLENLLETHPNTRADRRREENKAKKHPHAKFKGDGGKRRKQEEVEGKPAKRGERVGSDEY